MNISKVSNIFSEDTLNTVKQLYKNVVSMFYNIKFLYLICYTLGELFSYICYTFSFAQTYKFG